VTGDKPPVKGWRNRGILYAVDSAADAPEFEERGLECEGMSGNA
jgi:hypothetical protein